MALRTPGLRNPRYHLLEDDFSSLSRACELRPGFAAASALDPLPPATVARVRCSLAAAGVGAAIATGGVQRDPDTGDETVLDSAELLADGRWTPLCRLPHPVHSHASAGDARQLFICGGISGHSEDPLPLPHLRRLPLDRPGRRHWQLIGGGLRVPRWNHRLLLRRNRLWAFGGDCLGPDGLEPAPCQAVESFDLSGPESDNHQWKMRADRLPHGCRRLVDVARRGGNVYAVAEGDDGDGRHLLLLRFCLHRGRWDDTVRVSLPPGACLIACLDVAGCPAALV